MEIILASTSKYRKALLNQLGLNFSVKAPLVNEDELKNENQDVKDLCLFLAREKAKSIAHENPNALIIGSDQILSFEGEILNKPGTAEKNKELLSYLSDKTHFLYTSLSLISPKGNFDHLDSTELKMRKLSDENINDYVNKEKAWDCAGGYKYESSGIALFESIKCQDHSAITGLPLMALTSFLIQLGIGLSFLKRH